MFSMIAEKDTKIYQSLEQLHNLSTYIDNYPTNDPNRLNL